MSRKTALPLEPNPIPQPYASHELPDLPILPILDDGLLDGGRSMLPRVREAKGAVKGIASRQRNEQPHIELVGMGDQEICNSNKSLTTQQHGR